MVDDAGPVMDSVGDSGAIVSIEHINSTAIPFTRFYSLSLQCGCGLILLATI